MKKYFYYGLFTVLGILVSTIIHALIEIPVIRLLLSNFNRFGLGLTWREWYVIHDVVGTLLFILGAYLGFLQGKRWWRIIYIEKRR